VKVYHPHTQDIVAIGPDRPQPSQERRNLFAKRYVLMDKLGSGYFGTVTRAEDTLSGDFVALKILHPEFLKHRNTNAIRLFQNESVALRSISHPAVVAFRGSGYVGRLPYFAMEVIKGKPLDNYPKYYQKSLSKCLPITSQIFEALSAMHRRGIIHRDVSADNVMLDNDGESLPQTPSVKIIDLGYAKVPNEWDYASTTKPKAEPIGNATYIAPEMTVRGTSGTPAADVYSASVVLYSMACGALPFRGSIQELLELHAHGEPPSPISFEPSLPDALSRLILHGMGKNPRDRPTALEMKTEIDAVRQRILEDY